MINSHFPPFQRPPWRPLSAADTEPRSPSGTASEPMSIEKAVSMSGVDTSKQAERCACARLARLETRCGEGFRFSIVRPFTREICRLPWLNRRVESDHDEFVA